MTRKYRRRHCTRQDTGLNQLDAGYRTLGRLGESALKNKFLYSIVRDWSFIQPGELVVGDNRTFDTRIKMYDYEKEKWIAVRPNICALIGCQKLVHRGMDNIPDADLHHRYCKYSRCLCGTLRNTALPAEHTSITARISAHRDSQRLWITPDGFQHSIFNELGMSLTNSIAYNAQAKTVERVFPGDMNSDYQNREPWRIFCHLRTPFRDFTGFHRLDINKPKKGHRVTCRNLGRPRKESCLSEQQYRMASMNRRA